MTDQEFEWRSLRPVERAVLDWLLHSLFPGCNELCLQLSVAQVRVIDAEGSLQFQVHGPLVPTGSRVPVSARYLDGPGDEFSPHVNLLLHVLDGKLHELEVYKDDHTPIQLGAYEVETTRIEIW